MKRSPILIVDRDPVSRMHMATVLRSARYDVDLVDDVGSAIFMLASRRFAAVIANLSARWAPAPPFLHEIRKCDQDVPVILATRGPSLATAIAALECGGVQYIALPISGDALVRTVSHAESAARFARAKRRRQASHGLGDETTLETRFELACSRIWMAYQPIISVRADCTVAYEALLRTDEPSLGPPPVFLAAGEHLGRLDEIGRRVRAAAAGAVNALPADIEIFVNLHPFDLDDDDLTRPEAPLSRVASRIVLEITERASLERVKDVKARIASLRSLGYRIAIDDLGAGYAGLSWLAAVEPDVVKLDMGLIRGIDSDRKRQQVVFCVLELCDKLRVRSVVEGVETEAERDTLVSLGADTLQGYLIGRPERRFDAAPIGNNDSALVSSGKTEVDESAAADHDELDRIAV